MTSDVSLEDQMLHSVNNRNKLFIKLVEISSSSLFKDFLISVSRPEEDCLFLTGSAGTGKTLMLSEALKIKLSKLKHRGTDVKIFVTTYSSSNTELLDKYKQHYLINIADINFTDMRQLCHDLNIEYDYEDPQSTMTNVVRSLSDKYTDSQVILLCDEVKCWKLPDWSNMETCHNVIWSRRSLQSVGLLRQIGRSTD